MAIDSGRVKEYEALQIAKQWESLARNVGKQLAISMADPLPPGGDKGRHSPKPGQKPSSPYEEGKSPYKGLQAGLQINPNSILLPFVPKDAETDEDYGEGDVPGHPDWKLSHTPHTPDTTYDDYGRPEKVPRYWGGNPGGGLIEIPWMKEEYQKIHPELEKLHNEKYHQELAHVNKDGTAHDWRAPGHGGIPVPGGEVNPHGRRGTNTWDDGRQRYTPEELKQIEDYMKSLQISNTNIYQGIPNDFDKILDPSGTQKVKPTLDQLRRGVKYKKGLA